MLHWPHISVYCTYCHHCSALLPELGYVHIGEASQLSLLIAVVPPASITDGQDRRLLLGPVLACGNLLMPGKLMEPHSILLSLYKVRSKAINPSYISHVVLRITCFH